MRVFAFRGLLILIIAAFSICLYKIIIIRNTYVHEEQVHNLVLEFAPLEAAENRYDDDTAAAGESDGLDRDNQDAASSRPNDSILDAQRKINQDIKAWIRVPNTYIDYPVVQSADCSFYLDHDVFKKKAAAGSLFIDSRNRGGFIDFNTIIYGHNMKNGTMFGNLENFGNKTYFKNNPAGQLFLADRTYNLEIFAYLKVKQDDSFIYGTISSVNLNEYIGYIKNRALNFNSDIQLESGDHIVTLSTCTKDYTDSRIVVLAKLKGID